MATRGIVKLGEDILRRRAREVTEFDARLGCLIDDMFETMTKANGVGLAAPQVGILKRVCVVCVDGETKFELVNPVILKESGSQVGPEGCLSVPGRNGYVKRPKKLTVQAYDRCGEKQIYKIADFEAVAFCHEIDHLDGILFIDKLYDKRTDG